MLNLNEQTEPKPVVSLRNTYVSAASAFVFIGAMGMQAGYSSQATVDMREPGRRFRGVTPEQVTWIASLPSFSGAMGNCIAGFISHRLGRQSVLIYVSASYVLSWLMVAHAPTLSYVYAGRLIGGFCSGVCCVAAPAYVVEISPPAVRGRLSAGFQVAFTLGIFLVMALGIGLRWSWLAVSGGIVTTLAACIMAYMPESPVWLIRKGRQWEALQGLKFLKGKRADAGKALQGLVDDLSIQQETGLTLKELLDPTLYKPLLLAVSLMFFQQFSGINPLMSYTVEIFDKAGSTIKSEVAAVIVAAVQVLGTVFSSSLMDRSGRRRLFMISSFMMGIALGALGLYSLMVNRSMLDSKLFGWIPLLSFVVYIFSYSLGMGPIPFVMTPEMTSIRTRSAVLAVATLSCSLFSFVITKVFEDMRTTMGDYGVFWTYCAFSFGAVVFCYFLLPETKGMSIPEIFKRFRNEESISSPV